MFASRLLQQRGRLRRVIVPYIETFGLFAYITSSLANGYVGRALEVPGGLYMGTGFRIVIVVSMILAGLAAYRMVSAPVRLVLHTVQPTQDERLGELVLQRGLLTTAQLDECRQIQARIPEKSLAHVILARRFLTVEVLKDLLHLTKGRNGRPSAAAPPANDAEGGDDERILHAGFATAIDLPRKIFLFGSAIFVLGGVVLVASLYLRFDDLSWHTALAISQAVAPG